MFNQILIRCSFALIHFKSVLCLQPEDKVVITVTWTPAEEGGVREVLGFIANGIVKHQAILLGKAVGAKTKKVNIWYCGL